MGMLKEQLRYLLRSLPNAPSAMRAALRHTELQALRRELDRLFGGLSASALDLQVTALGGASLARPPQEALACTSVALE
jgi:hypothetical protein